jgi:hypothetical protein
MSEVSPSSPVLVAIDNALGFVRILVRHGIVDGDDMERIQRVRSVVSIDYGNNASPDGDEIRVRNIEAAAVRQTNREGLERRD